MYRKWIKRLLDFISATFFIVVLSPIFIILFLTVRLFLGSPALFKQKRPGLNGKPFYLYKFRTMLDIHSKNGVLLSDAERLTRFGKILRSTSLDELPELFNVIKGDMSLVGPRPLLMDYLPFYSKHQRQRHVARPGITGWAQVNGRNTLSWEKKFEFDVWYVHHCSFFLDCRIIFLTLLKIIKREGISAAGYATMSRFDAECMAHQSVPDHSKTTAQKE